VEYLVLVGDRKGMRPQISAPITPNGMYFHSTPHPSPLSLLLSQWDGVQEDVWTGRGKGETG